MREILITGGIGDLFALESIWTPDERNSLQRIHWATKVANPLVELFQSTPSYRHVQHSVYPVCRKTYFSIRGVRESFPIQEDVDDWSIGVRFGEHHRRTFQGSVFPRELDAPCVSGILPEHYVVIQDSTPINPAENRSLRDLDAQEWSLVLRRLDELDTTGVVLNSADAPDPPNHPRILNLVGQTNLAESVAVLSRADGYIGIASSLCVLAAQLFAPEQLWVKGPESWLWANRYIYFAPHSDLPFLFNHLANKTPKQTLYKNMQLTTVRMKIMRHLHNELVAPGSIVDVTKEVAETLVKTDQAEYVTTGSEIRRAVVDPVKRTATKIKAKLKGE